jgi:SAM-dependent methyltransferase
MKYKLLETIVCPDCKKALECIVFDEKDEVIDGFLSCNNCGKTYPIVNSIPRMVENRLLRETESFKHFIEKYRNRLPVEYNYGKSDKLVSQKTKKEIKTMKAFGFEWTKWTSSVHTTATKKINEKIEGDRFFEQTNIKPSFLKNKFILDAGCGMGRYTYIANKFGAEVVGVDFGESVESARENTKGLPNVHIIQADLFNLPFRKEAFDFIFSIGVLHHTSNAEKAFQKLVSLLKKGGVISIYVYRKKPPLFTFGINAMRAITTRIPLKVLYYLTYIPYIFTKIPIIKDLSYRKKGGFLPIPDSPNLRSEFFDGASPPLTTFHTEQEVMNWFKKMNLNDIEIYGVIPKKYGGGIGAKGRKGFGRWNEIE